MCVCVCVRCGAGTDLTTALWIVTAFRKKKTELTGGNTPSEVSNVRHQQISSLSDIFRRGSPGMLKPPSLDFHRPRALQEHLDRFHLTVNKSDQLIPAVSIRLDPLPLNLFVGTDQSFCYQTLTDLKLMSSRGKILLTEVTSICLKICLPRSDSLGKFSSSTPGLTEKTSVVRKCLSCIPGRWFCDFNR